jgi:autotransporter-associated beta strand protein
VGLTVNGNGTFSGSLRGTLDFTVMGGGQTLAGSNSHTGATKIMGGTLNLANPSGQCLPGDLLLDGAGAAVGLNLGSANQLSPAALITMASDFNAASFILNGNQTIGGLVSTGAGGNRIVQGQGVLTLNPPAGQTNDFEGLVYVRDGTSPLGLVKTGAGTQILGTRNTPNGANALGFSGGLLISDGTMWLRYSPANFSLITNHAALVLDLPADVDRTLAITGTGTITKLGGGALWLQTSAAGSQFDVLEGTLGGEGAIAAPVTVAAGATLSPGHASVGQLSINNALTLAAGSQTLLEIDRAHATRDSLVGLTTLNYGGTLTVNSLGGTFASGDSYKLFSAASYSGNFAATNLPALDGNLQWSWNPSTGTLAVVPYATTPTDLVAVQKGSTLELSWPVDHIGWLLQVQTNSLSVGLGTNWSVWPGSAATNQVSVPVEAANGSVFYRLSTP